MQTGRFPDIFVHLYAPAGVKPNGLPSVAIFAPLSMERHLLLTAATHMCQSLMRCAICEWDVPFNDLLKSSKKYEQTFHSTRLCNKLARLCLQPFVICRVNISLVSSQSQGQLRQPRPNNGFRMKRADAWCRKPEVAKESNSAQETHRTSQNTGSSVDSVRETLGTQTKTFDALAFISCHYVATTWHIYFSFNSCFKMDQRLAFEKNTSDKF